MEKIILIYAVLAIISLSVTYFFMNKSKYGYEDKAGYHEGKPPDNMGKIPRCPREYDHKKDYELNEISPQVYECGCGTIFWFKDCAHWEILTHDDVQKMANICANCKHLAKYAQNESGEKDCQHKEIGQIINSVNYNEAEIFGCNHFESNKELK